MKPISSRFLTSTVTLHKKTGDDAYARPVYDAGTEVSRVGLEAPKKSKLDDLGEQAEDKLVLYHDIRKSTSAIYKKGDKVVYGGESYYVREAQLYPNPDAPHHWEVRLT